MSDSSALPPHTSASVPKTRVVVLSGPSGSGKSTVVERVIAESKVKLVEAISATTRPPRPGEVDGQDYYFLSPEKFEDYRQRGEFLECAEVFGRGYWYGTLKSELDRIQQEGAWAFLEIDVQGALNVMQMYPDAITIFLTTPSVEEFENRLRQRSTDSEESIQSRLKTAHEELKLADRYRYQVVNDTLDRAVNEVCEILVSQETT